MFTKEELQAIATFLKRTQITGAEATAIVILQQKIAKLLSETKEKEPKEDKK